jgi:hypothetical protein
MIQIVVIENNEIQCKEIVNKISKVISNAKIFGIFYNVNEAILTIIENKIDIVIFNEDKQNISCKEFFNKINKKYKKDIIFISSQKIELKSKKSIFIYSKNLDNTEIIDKIVDEILSRNIEFIIDKIKNELEKLNFNFSHIGTDYLIFTIYEVYRKKCKKNINLSKDIFPIVGKQFIKDSNAIHSGIKREIINMYYDCEEGILKDYFDFNCYDERPRLKEIIFKIIEKIK